MVHKVWLELSVTATASSRWLQLHLLEPRIHLLLYVWCIHLDLLNHLILPELVVLVLLLAIFLVLLHHRVELRLSVLRVLDLLGIRSPRAPAAHLSHIHVKIGVVLLQQLRPGLSFRQSVVGPAHLDAAKRRLEVVGLEIVGFELAPLHLEIQSVLFAQRVLVEQVIVSGLQSLDRILLPGNLLDDLIEHRGQIGTEGANEGVEEVNLLLLDDILRGNERHTTKLLTSKLWILIQIVTLLHGSQRHFEYETLALFMC